KSLSSLPYIPQTIADTWEGKKSERAKELLNTYKRQSLGQATKLMLGRRKSLGLADVQDFGST
ncbi:1804_t:CDS:2, partial [Funneliformis caledonium]